MRRRTAELVHAYVRFADQIAVALADETFTARDYLVRTKADTIRLTATQLLALGAQRRVWEQRMGHLLLGSPRTRRATNEKDNQPGKAFPGGEIYLSFSGLGDRLAARVAGEIGEHIEQFDSPNALACLQQWAFCSLTRSGWAWHCYDQRIADHHSHHAALRGARHPASLMDTSSRGAPGIRSVTGRDRPDHTTEDLPVPAGGDRDVTWDANGRRYPDARSTAL